MLAEKQMLCSEEILSQTALALPDRELLHFHPLSSGGNHATAQCGGHTITADAAHPHPKPFGECRASIGNDPQTFPVAKPVDPASAGLLGGLLGGLTGLLGGGSGGGGNIVSLSGLGL